ncbi:MAG: sulfite exporter TauE/SafE family protein [Rhodospirillaceae bacterium]|jgi:uncharacterized protein|nr:sulfite exporter TauE/SafE family protein [Rhodospirillaceae bacterium]
MVFGQFDSVTLAVIALAFLLGGFSKGGVGFGLPLIAMPIMANVISIPLAIGLLSIPIVASNTWQAFSSGLHGAMFRRFWTLILALVVATAAGAQVLTRVDQAPISIFIGFLVALFVISQAFSLRLSVTEKAEARTKPVIGLLSGFLGGISGIFGPPLLSFLVALKLPKDEFMCAVGLIYLTGIFPLFGTLIANGVISADDGWVSLAACVPMFVGAIIGAWMRNRVSQTVFQRVVLIMLFLVALNLIRRGFI